MSGKPLGPRIRLGLHTIADVAFSPDGALLALAGGDAAVRLWDVAARRLAGAPLANGPYPVYGVAFSPDGATLATVADFGLVRLWDVESRQPRGEPLRGHVASVHAASFSSDGRLLATGGDDATVRVWDVATQKPREVLVNDTDSAALADGTGRVAAIRGLAFSPRRPIVAAAGESGDVGLWDLGRGHALSRAITGHRGWVRGVAFTADGPPVSGGVDR